MKTLYETARDSLIVIESIASGSTTTNSLHHLARLAREGLTAIESADRAQQGEPVDERAAVEAWANENQTRGPSLDDVWCIYLHGKEAGQRSSVPEAWRRCKACLAPRKGETCHKCGGPTFVPHESWEEPKLPPVDRIRALAREVGYAIGEHGTKERDLDLIAAPWVDEAVSNAALLEHIAKGLGATVIETEDKPLGRYAATLQMDGFYKPIDISVCAATKAAAPADAPKEPSAFVQHLHNSAKLVEGWPEWKRGLFAGPVPDTGIPTAGEVASTINPMCERKTNHIMERDGYEKSGYVLRKSGADICVSDGGAVAWFTPDQWNWLMFNRMHTTFDWPLPLGHKAAPVSGTPTSGAVEDLLEAARESLRMHDEVTGGQDYGYISPKLRDAVAAFGPSEAKAGETIAGMRIVVDPAMPPDAVRLESGKHSVTLRNIRAKAGEPGHE